MKSGYVRKRNDYTMLRPDVPVKKICQFVKRYKLYARKFKRWNMEI